MAPSSKKNVLFISGFYDQIGPLSHIDHISCFGELSRHKFYYHNFIYEMDPDLELSVFDAIVIGHNFWPANLTEEQRSAFRRATCPKLIFLQDEYQFIDEFNVSLNEMGISVIFSCASEANINRLYSQNIINSLRYTRSVLPGYVPARSTKKNLFYSGPRSLDIGYRSRSNCFFLGELGYEKVSIAENLTEFARVNGYSFDISTREEDRIYGESWYRFLQSSKFQLGTPSGSSVVDFNGGIIKSLCEFRNANPSCTFDDVRHILKPHEKNIVIDTISPRIFEYAACGSAMLLTKGEYGGILEEWRHYIPINKDYSNLSDLNSYMKDDELWHKIRKNAYEDLIRSEKYSYRTLVDLVDEAIDELASPYRFSRQIGAFDEKTILHHNRSSTELLEEEIRRTHKQRISFTKTGMNIRAYDIKTKMYVLCRKLGLFKSSSNFSNWMAEAVFGNSTRLDELICVIKLSLWFPEVRAFLLTSIVKIRNKNVFRIVDDILLLALLKTWQTSEKLDKTCLLSYSVEAPDTLTIEVKKGEGNKLNLLEYYYRNHLFTSLKSHFQSAKNNEPERKYDIHRKYKPAQGERNSELTNFKLVRRFRLNLTSIFPFGFFDPNVKAYFKVGKNKKYSFSDFDGYFHLLSLGTLNDNYSETVFHLVSWASKPVYGKDKNNLDSLISS